MIGYLRGRVADRGSDQLLVEAGGVGYEVSVTPQTLRRIPADSPEPVEFFISESSALYGGGTTLYGFLTREEKEIFLCLREHVPSTGAKKALEHLEKASRSLPDFRRAILEGDARMLSGVFGFTGKTAERLISSLKDKLAQTPGLERLAAGRRSSAGTSTSASTRSIQQAFDALVALGYRPTESRQSLDAVTAELQGREAPVEDLIRRALKQL